MESVVFDGKPQAIVAEAALEVVAEVWAGQVLSTLCSATEREMRIAEDEKAPMAVLD
jgi:hypothetical protein